MLKAITVSQLNNYIKQVFEAESLLHSVRVIGDIDGISKRGNAVYFSLRDGEATINCVSYKPDILNAIKSGTNVQVTGTVGYWHKAGKISFTVYHVEAFGLGTLMQQFQQLLDKLKSEGFFDAGVKKAIPTDIKRIGLVTSKQGAVLHDFVKVVQRRNGSIDIVLYPVLVQGIGSERSIIQGIEHFGNCKDIDVIVVARGGGSKDDLASFNSEALARAVFASQTPVVSAIGHETDWTLIDFVADLRASTPSVAAELVVPMVLTQRERVIQTWKFLKYIVQGRIEKSINFDAFVNHVYSVIERTQSKVRELGIFAESNNPLRILQRGYAKVSKDGQEIISVAQVKTGDKLVLRMQDGTMNVIREN